MRQEEHRPWPGTNTFVRKANPDPQRWNMMQLLPCAQAEDPQHIPLHTRPISCYPSNRAWQTSEPALAKPVSDEMAKTSILAHPCTQELCSELPANQSWRRAHTSKRPSSHSSKSSLGDPTSSSVCRPPACFTSSSSASSVTVFLLGKLRQYSQWHVNAQRVL